MRQTPRKTGLTQGQTTKTNEVMRIYKTFFATMVLFCTVRADDLGPQEIEKMRESATQVFEGTVQNVQNSGENNPSEQGVQKVAKVKISSVTKGDLKVADVADVIYYFRDGMKPRSPSLRPGTKYNFFIHKDPKGRLILSDSWLAKEPVGLTGSTSIPPSKVVIPASGAPSVKPFMNPIANASLAQDAPVSNSDSNPASSAPLSFMAVLIVVALALLWLLLKRRS